MGHLIRKIHVDNFKSIRNQEFELSNFTPLVGYNNTGKSNILDAVKWVLRKIALAEGASIVCKVEQDVSFSSKDYAMKALMF